MIIYFYIYPTQMTEPYNQRIVDTLEKLRILRLMEDSKWEAIADQKAIDTVKGLTIEIKSIDDVKGLPNIGKGISKHIQEILSNTNPSLTGIPDLDNLSSEEHAKLESLADLMQVHGVGIKKALKYYEQGYTKAEDLVKEKGLTHRQQVGTKYLKEFKQGIPRAKIQAFENRLKQQLHNFNQQHGSDLRYIVTGSYRRQAEVSNDIDVILVSPVDEEVQTWIDVLIKYLLDAGILVETITQGSEKYEGVAYLDKENPAVRIDFVLVHYPEQYPYALLYFTGSKQFNIDMREKAKKKGFHLGNVEMLDPSGKNVPVNTEEDIFKALGMSYQSPKERSI